MQSLVEAVRLAKELFTPQALPRAFVILDAVHRVVAGEDCANESRQIRCRGLAELAAAPNPVALVLKTDMERYHSDQLRHRVDANLGQLLIGQLAERAFENIYRAEMQTNELRLEDDRRARTDTDYRVLNGQGRPVFRMNIKFHGSPFRNARELVGLEPSDCFALATYKIHHAITKQEVEHLPYIFVIVGVPNLTGESAGGMIPEQYREFARLIMASAVPGKRNVEDHIVRTVLEAPQEKSIRERIDEAARRIREAGWRVLSARRADLLVREKLFERVFAVRVPRFTRNYRNAELDMHFSISQDLVPLRDFLAAYRDHGLQGLAMRLERGTI